MLAGYSLTVGIINFNYGTSTYVKNNIDRVQEIETLSEADCFISRRKISNEPALFSAHGNALILTVERQIGDTATRLRNS